MNWFQFFIPGLRALQRDARTGEMRLLAMALVIAVAAVASVGFLADRISRALDRNSAQVLGADLVLQGSEPAGETVVDQARRLGLQTARTVQFPSMVSTPEHSQLVSLKAVDPGYPLRGSLRTAPAPGEPDASAPGVPGPGTVWVDPQVLSQMSLKPGDMLQVGDLDLKIARVITLEPDRSVQFVNVAPRALINRSDLPATGLLGPASRASHALLVAGPDDAVRQFRTWLESRLARGEQLATMDSARPEITGSLKRGHQFMILVALLAVMIAAVAVGLATRQLAIRHRDGIAVMRCLGATRRRLGAMIGVEFVALALLASAMGVCIGFAVQGGLAGLVAGFFGTALPSPGWGPAWQGGATGLVLLLGFALPPLLTLRDVPPARVLRRDLAGRQAAQWTGWTVGIVVFLCLSWWVSGDVLLGGIISGGFLLALLVFAGLAWVLVSLLDAVRHQASMSASWRFAVGGLGRRKGLAITQVGALAIGLMALLLLAVARNDLLASWRDTLPANAPNTFLINIQPDQREALLSVLKAADLGETELAPMVRGRLVAIDGRPVDGRSYDSDRARRLVEREFNLSYLDVLPRSNTLKQGRWLDLSKNEVSIETGLASTLGIKQGDRLTFDVAGQAVDVDVTSLRDVRWDSFDVNFFALLTAKALRDAPATYITALYLPPDKLPLKQTLVRDFPNLTVFDVGAILGQVQLIIDQAVRAVQLLFLFTLAAGVVVLCAVFFSTRDERTHEAAILRVLGASNSVLAGALRVEMLLVGVVSGLLAAAGAVAVAWVLAHEVFEFSFTLPWWPWPAGALLGAAVAYGAGAIALRGVLRSPPMATLREVA